jgi:hypothetical protein
VETVFGEVVSTVIVDSVACTCTVVCEPGWVLTVLTGVLKETEPGADEAVETVADEVVVEKPAG